MTLSDDGARLREAWDEFKVVIIHLVDRAWKWRPGS